MDDERQPANPAGLVFNNSVFTGGHFTFYLPSQGEILCYLAMDLADGDPEVPNFAAAPGASFGHSCRGRGPH